MAFSIAHGESIAEPSPAQTRKLFFDVDAVDE
jgi:hypothetical protein